MSEWQPIETAPKDGTKILAYQPPGRDDDPTIAVVSWYTSGPFVSYEPAGDGLFRQVRHGEPSSWWEGGPWSPWRATHWMPLPAPPRGALFEQEYRRLCT